MQSCQPARKRRLSGVSTHCTKAAAAAISHWHSFAVTAPLRPQHARRAQQWLTVPARAQGDAIVNAANVFMLGGGGVDGAIHAAAGGKLHDLCAAYPAHAGDVQCPEGHARITAGCELPAKWVIHTVGPIYENQAESEPMLKLAFACASSNGETSLSLSSQ